MATPISQPVRSSGLYLLDMSLQKTADVGLILDDTVTLDSIGLWPVDNAGDIDLYWFEDDTVFPTMALSAAVTNTTTSVTANVVSNFAHVGDLIRASSPANGVEIWRVTAVASKALTIARAQQGTSIITVSTTATLTIVGNAMPEGATLTVGVSQQQVRSYNYFQIFTDTYQVSGSAAVSMLQSAESAFQREREKALQRQKGRINAALYHNRALQQMTGSVPGYLKGITGFVSTNKYWIKSGGIYGTNTSTLLTWTKLNKFLWNCRTSGGSSQVLILGGAAAIEAVRACIDLSGTKFVSMGYAGPGGVYWTSFISRNGQMVYFLYDKHIPTDELVAIDIGNPQVSGVWFAPVKGRTFLEKKDTGLKDLEGGALITEGSLIVKNEKCHGRIYGITGAG